MINYEKLTALAKKRGLSFSYLGQQLGKSRNYLLDFRSRNADLPADATKKLAALLGTTPGYLTDQPDDLAPESNVDVLQDVLDILRYRPECKILFSTLRKASAEDVLKAAKIIDALRDE